MLLGRLKANQTLEGARGSITSVDFDPSVRTLRAWTTCPLPGSPLGGCVGGSGV